MSVTRPVLVVQHEDECPPAWFGDWLADGGVPLDVRRAYAGDPLPESLDEHAGLLVLGGAMGADDDADCPWLAPTKRLLEHATKTGVPTLGICLGHQLLAVATGGRVDNHSAGRQCGLLPVGWTSDAGGDPLFGPLVRAGGYNEPVAVQWNVDVVTALPLGATALAYAPGGALQAMRVSPTSWGIQSHPEAGAGIVKVWVEGEDSAGETEQQLLAQLEPAEERLRRAWQPLADSFTALCAANR